MRPLFFISASVNLTIVLAYLRLFAYFFKSYHSGVKHYTKKALPIRGS